MRPKLNDLHRDAPSERLFLLREVHHAHAPFSEEANDSVWADSRWVCDLSDRLTAECRADRLFEETGRDCRIGELAPFFVTAC